MGGGSRSIEKHGGHAVATEARGVSMRAFAKRSISTCLLIAVPFVGMASASESIYTRVRARQCLDMSKPEFGLWRCFGPGGYVAEFFDEGNIAGVNLRIGKERAGSSLSTRWRGAGDVFGELVEWRMTEAGPIAAILRRFRVESDADGMERTLQELVVFKLSPRFSCLVQAIEVREGGANLLARSIADRARSMPCLQSE